MMPQVRSTALIEFVVHSISARTPVRVLAGALGAALLLGGCAGFPWGKQENLRGGYGPKDKVAAILPGTGPVANVAEALRQGLTAAHGADDTGTRPVLNFIASDNPEKIAETYKKAVDGGTTQVIGPLLKPAVDRLAAGPALKVPTLALNQTSKAGKTAANLYQFALAPETEAVDVANKAKAQGLTRALVLAPQGEAGQRRADAFRRQWKTLGGTLVGEAAVAPAKDPAKDVAALLAKGPADFLFLAADVEQARPLYAALRGKAAALPVVATSAVFPGGTDGARDRALAGLYFVDTPWMLGVGAAEDPLALARLKRGSGALATPLGLRLYAMGIDAYRLAPRLATLAKTPGATFPGATGTLSIDAQGRVQRALTLAQFTPTGPKPVAAITAAAKVQAAANDAKTATKTATGTATKTPAKTASGTATKTAARTATGTATKSATGTATGTKGDATPAAESQPQAEQKAKPRPKPRPAAKAKPAVPVAAAPAPADAPAAPAVPAPAPAAPVPAPAVTVPAPAPVVAPPATAAPAAPAPEPVTTLPKPEPAARTQ